MSSIVRFLTALLVLSLAASYNHINAERVCGRNLLETMKIVCKYQFETIGKRSGKLSCLFVDSTIGKSRNQLIYVIFAEFTNSDAGNDETVNYIYQHHSDRDPMLDDVDHMNQVFDPRLRRSVAADKAELLPFYYHTGIVKECCNNICSFDTMLSYCRKA